MLLSSNNSIFEYARIKCARFKGNDITEFIEGGTYFKIIIYKKISQQKLEPINEPINLSESQRKIIKTILKNPQISKSKMGDENNISEATVKRIITKLKAQGIIERIGSNKSGYWKVINQSIKEDE